MRIRVAKNATLARPGQVASEAEDLAPHLSGFHRIGLDHAVLAFDWADPDDLVRTLERTARDVLPLLR